MRDCDATQGGSNGEFHPLLHSVRELRAEVAELNDNTTTEPLTDALAHWLTAHYAATARSEGAKAGTAGIELKILRALTEDVVALRRGDHTAASLALERERVQLDRQVKIEAGLDALAKEVQSIPAAMHAYETFARLVRTGAAIQQGHAEGDLPTLGGSNDISSR